MDTLTMDGWLATGPDMGYDCGRRFAGSVGKDGLTCAGFIRFGLRAVGRAGGPE